MPKAQGLEYEAQVPAFLQRLKQGHAALDGRHNVQIPRAHGIRGKQGRLNMTGEEGEDDPVMLDESGNTISKDEMEALKRDEVEIGVKSDAATDDQTVPANLDESDGHVSKVDTQNVSSGFGKKRKAIKVVGENGGSDGETEEGANTAPIKSMRKSTKDLQHAVSQNKENTKREGTKKAKKKKVKLSFDEPE